MLRVIEIIFCNIRIFCCYPDQFMMLQKWCGIFVSAYTHLTFSISKIQYFMYLTSFFQDCIFSNDSDIRCAIFYICRNIRSFCKKETEFQFFIGENQLPGIFIFHLFTGNPDFLK